MNFAELKRDLRDQFPALNAARAGRLINRAYDRLSMEHLWPFREASGGGTTPFIVADLGQIEAVTNESRQYELEESSYKDLVGWYGDLAVLGTPIYWYRAYVSGDPVVVTFPTSSDTIGVQYFRTFSALSEGNDVPEVPVRYHGLIVDIASLYAYRDLGQQDQAQALQQDVDRQLNGMVEDLLPQQTTGHQRITFQSEDW